MTHGIFHTKERKIAAVVIFFIVIVVVPLTLYRYIRNSNYKEQTVMANEYLRDGDYKHAVNAYLKVISMRSGDEEALTIGLSEAYIGLGNYDKALEVLRSCYQKMSGVKIKEKIEEVTIRKIDYEYLQTISRADKYYANGEYDKAINEYKKAKLIKSKEIISYLRIAEAYIKKDDYTSARKEVIDGLNLTNSDGLYKILDKINIHLIQQKYKDMVEEADEYIYQENYEDGIKKYKEAILLMPKKEKAYLNLAEAYLMLNKYDDVIVLSKEASIHVKNDELKSMLKKATVLKELQDKRRQILSDLLSALNPIDVNKIRSLMNLQFFQKDIASGAPVYYSALGEGKITTGTVMIIYGKNRVYFGGIKDGLKKDFGICFLLNQKDYGQGYYYYEGEWNNNTPNGIGKTEEQTHQIGKSGKPYNIKTVTEGLYNNGYENGRMQKSFYQFGKVTETIQYNANNGVPEPIMDENDQPIIGEDEKSFAIAMIYRGEEPTGKYYFANKKTLWGVKSFVKD